MSRSLDSLCVLKIQKYSYRTHVQHCHVLEGSVVSEVGLFEIFEIKRHITEHAFTTQATSKFFGHWSEDGFAQSTDCELVAVALNQSCEEIV